MSQTTDRRNPFAGLSSDVPMTPGSEVVPQVLTRPPRTRRTPLRPSERRRRERQVALTFSDAGIPGRLRALADRWGLKSPSGNPNVSAVVEYLLRGRLEAAERGEIRGPGMWG